MSLLQELLLVEASSVNHGLHVHSQPSINIYRYFNYNCRTKAIRTNWTLLRCHKSGVTSLISRQLLQIYSSVDEIRILFNVSKGSWVANDTQFPHQRTKWLWSFPPVGLSPLVNTAVYSKSSFHLAGKAIKFTLQCQRTRGIQVAIYCDLSARPEHTICCAVMRLFCQTVWDFVFQYE